MTHAKAILAQARAHLSALRHRLREDLGEKRLMTLTISAFMLLYMTAAYLLVNRGLSFVHALPLLGPLLTERMLYLLFFFFFLMLVMSNAAITGISLFRRQETGWHLSLPMPHGSIVIWKTIEGLLISSWGLILLSAPILAGFGRIFEAGPFFYISSLAAVVCLIALASNVSTWFLLMVVKFYRPWWLKVGGTLVLGMVVYIIWQIRDSQTGQFVSSDVATNVRQILGHTQICTHPLLPSSWVAEVVIASGRELPGRAMFFTLLLLSNAMAAWILTALVANRYFYPSWNRALQHSELRNIANGQAVFANHNTRPEFLLRRVTPFRRSTLALVGKDALTFLREPMQWGQCTLIFGLLLLYTSNLRNLGYNYKDPTWSAIISHLNLTVCCLAMSTLTTRFVFPQFSLEGQRLWILGLAPFPLTRVIQQKLWLNLAASTPLTTLLVVVSCFSLKLPLHRAVFFVSAIVLMTVGLNALALSLGTLLPNLRETNSAKIVSSFGGTLCLVASFFYIAIAMTVLIVPTVISRRAASPMPLENIYGLEASAIGALFILTVLIGGIPYYFALRRTKTLANLGEL